MIIYDTLQALYYIIFVPIHFCEEGVYVDMDKYELMCWYYLLINLIYYMVFYLDKRHFEMQFNSNVIGRWKKIFDNNSFEASNF